MGERAMGGKDQAKRALQRSERQIAMAGMRKAQADLKAWQARITELDERAEAARRAAATGE